MPTQGILGKVSLFKRLKVLELRRRARQNDALSKNTLVSHGTALILVHDMLKQNWSVLLLERRFLQSSRHFTDYHSRNEVVDKLLAALEAYESALTHQFKCPEQVRYDLRSFERALFDATCALHAAGDRSVSHDVVERPKKGWQCTEEYQGWKGNFRALMNPGCGKLRIKEWDVAEVGKLMDGHFTVTLFGEDGQPSPEVPFCDTLPAEFDGPGDDSSEESGPESELEVVLARTPQSKRGSLVIRLRNADAELDMPKAETHPALTLRVKNEHV